MNPLPPMAFTTETLSKAYAWLQTQPENIRALASNPEMLVSLYLKTKLNGEAALDRPSIQNFRNELKSLAGMMGELDGGMAPPPGHAQAYPQPSPQTSPPPSNGQRPQPARHEISALDLDIRSRVLISQIREEMNLSSDSEALRMLIQLGAKSLQKIVK